MKTEMIGTIPSSGSGISPVKTITVTGVSVSGNVLTLQGSGLDYATQVSIQGVGAFTILNQTATELQAAAANSVSLALNTLYDLLVSSADASGGTTLSFSVPNTTQGSVLFAGASGAVSSDSSQIFWDDTDHWLGIGTSSPDTTLTVSGNVSALQSVTSMGDVFAHFANADNHRTRLLIDSYGGSSSSATSVLTFRHAAGTAADPTAVQAGDYLANISVQGYGATSYQGASKGTIEVVAEQTWTDASQPYYIAFQTTPVGTQNGTDERMRISSGGNVGIGTTNPGYLLDVESTTAAADVAYFQNGTGSCTINPNGSGGGLSCSSDARLKTDISSIDGALDKVLQIRGVTYRWKQAPSPKRAYGFVAQELEKVFPEFVSEDERGYKQVGYANFVAVLTSAIQELHAKFNEKTLALEKRVAALEAGGRAPASAVSREEFDALKRENAQLKSYLCAKDPGAAICR